MSMWSMFYGGCTFMLDKGELMAQILVSVRDTTSSGNGNETRNLGTDQAAGSSSGSPQFFPKGLDAITTCKFSQR
eukprot:CAMPEP_0172711326 /NCGR_PEP_ID=MMETSP1074-20121228/58691_1 /TAXON_ID=2916 /ORGANISM="Ceratium fusus, Strain PA161109" /LENGTH=74 /DNA_ID=CAMNT_0013534951 /DNA_START=111 /DNA_END=331 /DNA_ORIENTATION=-